MVQTWSSWKRFPDIGNGAMEAPVGPGVYEVRHTMTGRVIAFGNSANVAQALADLQTNGGLSPFFRLFRRQPLTLPRAADLEYRTCAAGSPPRHAPPRSGCWACARAPGAGVPTTAGPPAFRAKPLLHQENL